MDLYTLSEGRKLIKLTECDNKFYIHRLLNITILPGKDIEFNFESEPVGIVPIEQYNNLNKNKLISLSPYQYMDIIIKDIEMKKELHRDASINGILLYKGDCL